MALFKRLKETDDWFREQHRELVSRNAGLPDLFASNEQQPQALLPPIRRDKTDPSASTD